MYKQKFFTWFLAITLLLLLGSCQKEKTPDKRGVFVSTSSVTNITHVPANNTITVTAGGDADFVGGESISERGVVWASTSKPTIDNNKIAIGSGAGNFSTDITGLTFGETFYVRAYVISNSKAYYGKEVQFTASVPIPLIQNGDFETEGDAAFLTNAVNWKTDEADAGIIGRSTDCCGRNNTNFIWTYNTSKSFYQVVGTVPAAESDYAISFDGNYDWTDWGSFNADIGVIFSVYSGSDPTTRVAIDTVVIATGDFPGWGNNWGRKNATFSLPANSSFAGQNLVVEFDILPYIDPATGDIWDNTVWYNFDNISVIQTLK